MLVSRDESVFDFGDARLDLQRDRARIGWILSQMLAGESAALAGPQDDSTHERQAHLKVYLRMLDSIGVAPQPAHRALRIAAADLPGESRVDRAFRVLVLGGGMALLARRALVDTLPESQVRTLLLGLMRQTEPRIATGEAIVSEALRREPEAARHLLGLALAAQTAGAAVAAELTDAQHPVFSQIPAFWEHARNVQELRLVRLGVMARPSSALSTSKRFSLVASSLARRYAPSLNPFGGSDRR